MDEATASGKTNLAAPFEELQGAQFIQLTSFRKSGIGVPTAVWFAQVGDILYITTTAQSGKVKRIRANPRVLVAPCDARGVVTGPASEASTRVLPPEESAKAMQALRAKYGFRYDLIHLMGRIVRRGQSDRIFLAVTPIA